MNMKHLKIMYTMYYIRITLSFILLKIMCTTYYILCRLTNPSDDEQTLIVNEANIYWKMRGDEESFCRSNVNTCQGFTLRWKKISVELVVVCHTVG